MSLIPANRPVIGDDLDQLRISLGLSTSQACWLYGMSMTKWWTTVKGTEDEPDNPNLPLKNVGLALLVRFLADHPDASPLPVMPTPAEIFQLVKEKSPALDLKRFAIMFGNEASSGYRWITQGMKISPVQARLFLVFKKLYVPALKRSPSAAQSVMHKWDEMVEQEARSRGVGNIYARGRWTAGPDEVKGKPIYGYDLDELRAMLGLTTMDATWLFGLSMTKWQTFVRGTKKEPDFPTRPLNDPTLSLLVRVLREFPELCPVPPRADAQVVHEAIKVVDSAVTLKRIAVMFGCEASSGYRWLTVKMKISPVLSRLFSVFMYLYKSASNRSKAHKGMFLEYWNQTVQLEASLRGVDDVFAVGRWNATKLAGDKATDVAELALPMNEPAPVADKPRVGTKTVTRKSASSKSPARPQSPATLPPASGPTRATPAKTRTSRAKAVAA